MRRVKVLCAVASQGCGAPNVAWGGHAHPWLSVLWCLRRLSVGCEVFPARFLVYSGLWTHFPSVPVLMLASFALVMLKSINEVHILMFKVSSQ
jgi:hypothetical protein